jgi:hypothetical protein
MVQRFAHAEAALSVGKGAKRRVLIPESHRNAFAHSALLFRSYSDCARVSAAREATRRAKSDIWLLVAPMRNLG